MIHIIKIQYKKYNKYNNYKQNLYNKQIPKYNYKLNTPHYNRIPYFINISTFKLILY